MQPLPAGDKLGRWQHRRLSLRCGACGWTAAPLVGLLAAQLGPGATIAEAAKRLACRDCRGPVVAAALIGAAGAAPPPKAHKHPGMPVFGLAPVLGALDAPAWSASTHRGPCYVSAPDERRARLYAANAFADPSARRTISGLLPASPWMLPALVAVERAVGLHAGAVAEGAVMVLDRADDPRGALRVLALGVA